MDTELATRTTDVNVDDLQRIAKMMVYSGYFDSSRDAQQAIAQMAVKILAGREMGYGPFAAVQGIHVIQGKPVVSANLMAAAVKAHPRYDYRLKTNTATEVVVVFYQDGEAVGESSFNMDDAKAAGLNTRDNWKKFPRNMLFARAISNGVRWYCPDVFAGSAVYTADELDTDEVPVTVQPVAVVEPEASAEPPQAAPAPAPQPNGKTALRYASVAKAIQAGLELEIFNHQNHAQGAYDKLREKHHPDSAGEMFELWYAYITVKKLATVLEKDKAYLNNLYSLSLPELQGLVSDLEQEMWATEHPEPETTK